MRGRLMSRRLLIGAIAVSSLVLLTGIAGAGIVSSLRVTTRTVAGKSTAIVIDREGDAVYELGGESLANLKCVTSQCLKMWPPVEVRGAGIRPPIATGVPGPLSILQRVKGNLFQVMLDRHPLYYYAGDKIGTAKGQGIKSFGGTWHVVNATSASGTKS